MWFKRKRKEATNDTINDLVRTQGEITNVLIEHEQEIVALRESLIALQEICLKGVEESQK